MNSNTAKLQNALRSTGGRFKNYMFGGNMVPDLGSAVQTGIDANGNATFTAPMVRNNGKLANTITDKLGITGDPISRASALLGLANSVKSGIDQARYERQVQQEQRKLEQEQRNLEQDIKRAQALQQNEDATVVRIGDDYFMKVDAKDAECARDAKHKKKAKLVATATAIGAVSGSKRAVDEALSPEAAKRLQGAGKGVVDVAKGFGDMAVGSAIGGAIGYGANRAGYYGAKALDAANVLAAKRAEVKAQREALKLNQRYQKEQQDLAKKADRRIVT